MTNLPEQWLARHREKPLPILRQSRDFFNTQKEIPSVNISRLWEVMAMDQGLCLNILRLAGRSKKTTVNSVQHAIRMIGLPHVLSLPGTLPLVEEVFDENIQRIILSAHARAYHAARQCLAWSQLLHESTVEDIASASVCTELVIYLICCFEQTWAGKLSGRSPDEQFNLREAVAEFAGMSEATVGEHIAMRWGLPPLVRLYFSPTQNNEQKSRLVDCAHRLVRAVEHGWQSTAVSDVIHDLAAITFKPEEQLRARIHTTAARTARQSWQTFRPVEPAARMLPLAMPASENNNIIRLGSPASPARILEDTIKQLRKMPGADYSTIMSLAFRALSHGPGFSRVFFAVLGKERKTLHIRHIYQSRDATGLHRHSLPLEENRLLAILMKKPQCLHMHAGNAAKYLPLLSLRTQSLIKSENFVVMSLFAADKPVGLFYADRSKNRSLDAGRVKYFKIIVRETGQALAGAANDMESKNIVNA